jgi:hypothetical protein
MSIQPATQHFNVYTGYADTAAIYQALAEIANCWERCGITRVRVFHAGITNVYVTVIAREWYHPSYANDPDWQGDAQDPLEQHQLQCRTLSRPPHPEYTWRGQWRQFTTSDELHSYAAARLERLAALHGASAA